MTDAVEPYTPTIPLDEVVEKTIVLGYRSVLEMMGVNPDNAIPEHVIADFRAWLASKTQNTPESSMIRVFASWWDEIEDTGGYDNFADDVGRALDDFREGKWDERRYSQI